MSTSNSNESRYTINGEEYDLKNTGIDLTVFWSLPNEDRDEAVLNAFGRGKRKRRMVDFSGMELGKEDDVVEAVKRAADANEQDRIFIGGLSEFFEGEVGVRRLIMLMREKKISPYLLSKIKGLEPLTSFSHSKYVLVAPLYGLDEYMHGTDIPVRTTNFAHFPQRVWKCILETVEATEEQFGAYPFLQNEDARARWTEAWFAPLVYINFKSRIRNIPQKHLPATNTSKGGKVEIQYWLHGSCLIVLIEMKYSIDEGTGYLDNLAQLMAELDSADYNNFIKHLNILPIWGILTDGMKYHFLQYDSSTRTFSKIQPITIDINADANTVAAQMKKEIKASLALKTAEEAYTQDSDGIAEKAASLIGERSVVTFSMMAYQFF
ncbi:hypothetical protein HK104_005707 [Borealophlyctis nickersoniae]|nr:hypothetical protein HK104_005707 [Borealophlyctis nickersoniae]